MSNKVRENALFVCFGGLSNVGTMTGLAGLEVVKQVGPDKACIFSAWARWLRRRRQ